MRSGLTRVTAGKRMDRTAAAVIPMVGELDRVRVNRATVLSLCCVCTLRVSRSFAYMHAKRCLFSISPFLFVRIISVRESVYLY